MNFIHIILKAAKAAKVSGSILLAICTHESGLKNVYVPHDGGSPTYGICQVKYATAKMLGYSDKPENLMNPEKNAKYAALYLKYQHNRYSNWCKAIAAYNAGRHNDNPKQPGYPKNFKYVLGVIDRLDKDFQKHISCNTINNNPTYVGKL